MSRYQAADYTLLEKDHVLEIRLYAPYYTAVVEEYHLEDSRGFRAIFNYISGANENHEKIAMTVPVINELFDDSATTEFVMPREYGEETLPKPLDPVVKIKRTEGKKTASVTFSGTINAERIEKQREKLLRWIETKHIKPIGHTRLARYNSPFTLPLWRKNEILIDVE